MSISGLLKRGLDTVCCWWSCLSVSALAVTRLHKVFGIAGPQRELGSRNQDRAVQPQSGEVRDRRAARQLANINYWDADANTHQVNDAPLPWSYTISTTLPAVSANIMAQTDAGYIGCRITVDGELREHRSADGHNAQTFCLVKSA